MPDPKIHPSEYANPHLERSLVAGLSGSEKRDVHRQNLLRERMDKKVAPHGGTRPPWWLDRYGPGHRSLRDTMLDSPEKALSTVHGLAESSRKKADGYAEQAQEALFDALSQALGREPSEEEFDAAQTPKKDR